MDKNEAQELLDKYLNGQATKQERELIESWYNQQIGQAEDLPGDLGLEETEKIIYARLPKPAVKVRLWPRIAGIAAAIVFVLLGVWIYSRLKTPNNNIDQIAARQQISPGKNTAVLALSSGEAIQLSDAKSGISIDAERLAYNDGSAVDGTKELTQKLSLTTPKGGRYQLTLQDGSKVWINADSKLEFSSDFTASKQRLVRLQGEAYFEVAKDKRRPFIVETQNQRVEVLGTHFNINSYNSEPATKTTLLEGSVSVAQGNKIANTKTIILKPGQQSTLIDGKINVEEVEASYAVAWKEGYFMFGSERLEFAMNRIARWYNVEIKYEDPTLKNESIFGTISQYSDIDKVLHLLEGTKVLKFEIKGREIIIKRNKPN